MKKSSVPAARLSAPDPNEPQELDGVRLSVDMPEHGLSAGDEGTIVEVFAGGIAFLVDFPPDADENLVMPALTPDQFRVVWRYRDHKAGLPPVYRLGEHDEDGFDRRTADI